MALQSITLIGGGNMGRSLAGGLIRAGWPVAQVQIVDSDADQREKIKRDLGIAATADGPGAVAVADAVVLAVKPQCMADTIRALAEALRVRRPLIISVAAGIPLQSIHNWIGARLPLVRAMPNTPALIGAGATGMCCGADVTPGQKQLAERILGAVGVVQWVEKEDLIDVVTALSGSGPAYFFLLMEELIHAGVEMGLTQAQARTLIVQTALGTAQMASTGGHDPAELRRQVTSPGGTTEQALRVLEESGLGEIVQRAVRAARQRSGELADKFGTS